MTKDDVLDELDHFLQEFLLTIDRIYGSALRPNAQAILPRQARLTATVERMYDYGVLGLHNTQNLGHDELFDADYADAEIALTELPRLQWLLDEDAVRPPMQALKVVRMAVARHVLEGGQRYTVWEEAMPAEGWLTIAEVALLADMDEGSVRNAASRRGARKAGTGEGDTDAPAPALATEVHGKRTLVSIAEAKRWLAGRRGFVPTRFNDQDGPPRAAQPQELSPQVLQALAERAAREGKSLDECLAALLATAG